MLDIQELKQQFNEEFGADEELEESMEVQAEPSDAHVLEEAIQDMLQAYMEECIVHFLAARSRKMEDDGRYFYSKDELETFKRGYVAQGGNLNTLHIGSAYYDNGEWLCYEVCRKKYYDLETYYSRCQHRANGDKIFFS